MSNFAIAGDSAAVPHAPTSAPGTPFFPDAVTDTTGLSGNRPFAAPDPDSTPPAPTQDTELVRTAKKLTENSFVWLAMSADQNLTRLQADLAEEDPPSFLEGLLKGALRAAIAGATGSASEFLANLIEERGPLKEFFKASIRSGINDGVAAGTAALSKGQGHSLRAFIESQREAIRRAYLSAQTNWISGGARYLHTDDDARVFIAACSPDNVELAGKEQYGIARDAWLAYLAQARYGVGQSTAIDEDGASVATGVWTDMTSTEVRAERNADMPGRYAVDGGPDVGEAVFGSAKGVLTVIAELPEVVDIGGGLYGMDGVPRIAFAYLNGVNGRIRDQFVGKPLVEANVPRLIHCRVSGGADFEIRLNEQGLQFGRTGTSWLASRATVGHPQNVGKDEASLRSTGLDLLLRELIPTSFTKGINE